MFDAVMKKKKNYALANPELAKDMLELRRSSAASPQDRGNRRLKTRLSRKTAAIKDSIGD